jgi:hypothetical protein
MSRDQQDAVEFGPADYILTYRADEDDPALVSMRNDFIAALTTGPNPFTLQYDTKPFGDHTITFVRLRTDFTRLCRAAQAINLKMPIARSQTVEQAEKAAKQEELELAHDDSIFPPNLVDSLVSKLQNEEDANLAKRLHEYNVPFRMDRQDRFAGSGNPDTFFSQAQRSMLTFTILSRLHFGTTELQIGIQAALDKRAILSAYPEHDGPVEDTHNLRGELGDSWALFRRAFRPQPLERVRMYFGERIALYFAWIGALVVRLLDVVRHAHPSADFYTRMLVIPTILGLCVFFYGVYQVTHEYSPVYVNLSLRPTVLTNRAGKSCAPARFSSVLSARPAKSLPSMFVLVHSSCWRPVLTPRPLQTTCTQYKLSVLFDNDATIPMAFLMSVWGASLTCTCTLHLRPLSLTH